MAFASALRAAWNWRYRHVQDPVTGQYPPEQTIVSNIEYAPYGPTRSLTYGDGATQTRSHDSSYRLTRLLDDLNGTSLRDVSYGWSLRDNLLSTTDNLDVTQNEAFQYSAQQRLSDADGAYGDLDFAYDLNGNRTSRSVTSNGSTQSESYSYPLSSNRLQSTALGTSSRALSYDGAGNVTSDNLDGSIYTYSYDAANRMTALSINGVAQAEYRYNALGQQVSRYLVAEDKTIHTIHDLDGNRIAEFEYDPITRATVLLREYIWLEGEPIAVVENDQIYYLRTDHIGRPRFATDAAGLTVWQANYLPFGKLHVTTGNNPDLRIPGQWFQAESGLFQNWMRDYDPTQSRYLQADPLGLVDGPSLYGYTGQNPMKLTCSPERLCCTNSLRGFIL
ncbi:RHS repeat-associated core domain-containing protein [Pseudophaeobacter sp.]|uniref:RHS repeat domain-containing protein n=1 Tax=Pseudophaeobacter sp. TaxID=1971739 RepID=UPI00329913EE